MFVVAFLLHNLELLHYYMGRRRIESISS